MQESNAMRDRLLREFAEHYMEKLFYFCLKKTGGHSEAEDLTQDIALQIITALNKGTIPTSFSAWVWQIARNRYAAWAIAKHNRNESITGVDIGDYEIADESETILDEMIHTEQMALLRRELAFIKSDYRNIVVAYYIENKSVREIASLLALSETAVKQRLHRARILLKEGMDMAREFGKRSYNPEKIIYTNICNKPGELGQPWTLMDPKLNQNIFLACYDNPMTAEELAIEVGVALPYIDDIVKHLTTQTLLIQTGNTYETNFTIISREAQKKIHSYYEETIPLLITYMTESIDSLMAQFEEADLCYYGPYQSYEEAKWMLLPDYYADLYSLCESSPKIKLGNTKKNNNGIWDVVAFEKCDFTPDPVGIHSQTNGFVHYRFAYAGIQNRTPANLSQDETYELSLMVKKQSPCNVSVAEKLVQYGYAHKQKNQFVPRVSVISQSTQEAFGDFCQKKDHSTEFVNRAERMRELHQIMLKMVDDINRTVKEILYEDLPNCIRNNSTMMDALLESICATSHTLSYLVKHALASGWLKYNETTSPAIGAYFNMP